MNIKISWFEFRYKYYPRLRRTSPVGITHSGGTRRVYSCICGDSVSMCATWPVTRRVRDFIVAHNSCRTLPPGVRPEESYCALCPDNRHGEGYSCHGEARQ